MSSDEAPFSKPSVLYKPSPDVDSLRWGLFGSVILQFCKSHHHKTSVAIISINQMKVYVYMAQYSYLSTFIKCSEAKGTE